MTAVLLAPERVEVLADQGSEDGHGWQGTQVLGVLWEGTGNLQEAQPVASPSASEQGGAGPFSPRHVREGVAHLPIDCPILPGGLLRIRGQVWVAELVQVALDPTGTGVLSSLAVTVTLRDEVVADG